MTQINKKNGIYYTPPELAEFLVKPLLSSVNGNTTIFDPAYGDGALLLAAERMFNREGIQNSINLFGCDIAPQNGKLKHFPKSNIFTGDFFNYPPENKFDIILMNPPYIRHHLLPKIKMKEYQESIHEKCKIDLSADLWGYFLIKSLSHLKDGGSMGVILPWSFLQADYAQIIRRHITRYFKHIKILTLGEHYFETALERVVILWLKQYGHNLKSIQYSFTKHIDEEIVYFPISEKQWEAKSICILNEKTDIDEIIDLYHTKFNFHYFENYADVKIGVVTGADEFFIQDRVIASDYDFDEEIMVPIFTSVKQFMNLSANDDTQLKMLITLSQNHRQKYLSFIKKGIEQKYNLRAHSLRRNPWYSINPGKIPDAFFPYRVSKIPYLVINKIHAQCTNSIHRIYFKKITEIEQKWIQISQLSIPGQLSLERNAKTYGSGVMKIEPIALKKCLVYKDSHKEINTIYKQISKMSLSNSNKQKVVQLATEFIARYLNIPKKICDQSIKILLNLQEKRMK